MFNKTGSNKLPAFVGKMTCEGVELKVSLWEKSGAKGTFFSGITAGADKVKTGDITIFKNHATVDKAPDIRGYFKQGEAEYLVAMWKKFTKKKQMFYAGTIKIKDPLMKYKCESLERLEAPIAPDDGQTAF